MALKTLKGVEEIGGFPVFHYPRDANDTTGSVQFVLANHNENRLTFILQNGPIKERGVNGCQVDTLIEAAKLIIEGLNEKFPCEENEGAIHHFGVALSCLAQRTKDRTQRGVEGTDKP